MKLITAGFLLFGLPNIAGAQILGAPAAALETPYQTEHAWAIREVTADINEMARYRVKGPAAPPALTDPIRHGIPNS